MTRGDPSEGEAHPPLPRDPEEGALPAAELVLRYRSAVGAPPPRRIRLEIPGWAGADSAPADGATAQPWHCQPFVEGATFGLELVYPYADECSVHNDGGAISFHGPQGAAPKPNPFGVFAAGHYGMGSGLDLLPPLGYCLRLEPHPRYFTDSGGEVPLAVPGHLHRFWPKHFFVVFRAPPAGGVHWFRPGEPYAQLLLVPESVSYQVLPLEAEAETERAWEERQITRFAFLLAKRLWRTSTGIWMDDKYKQLLRLFRREGPDAVRQRLRTVEDQATRSLPPT